MLRTYESYENEMKEKYEAELSIITDKLMMAGSQERGYLLEELLYDRALPIAEELKYYLFCYWWTSIDANHHAFEADDIKYWLEVSKVKLDFSGLNIDEDGYIEVYRGVNEYSNSEGLSFTTDKKIALKFAWGATVRHRCKENNVLVCKVKPEWVLAIINSRNESELLSGLNKFHKEYDIKELLDAEEKYRYMYQDIKQGKAEPNEEFNALRKKCRDLQIEYYGDSKLTEGEIPF